MLYFLRLTKALYLCFIVFTLSSCGSSSDSVNKDTQISNSIPIANAGINQLTPFNTLVLLNGSNSSDQDNDPLSYRWEFLDTPLNSQTTIINANSFNPTFLPDLRGDYEVSLVVNDQIIDSAADTVLISVTEDNIIPVANAGPDQSVSTNSLVSLDGNRSVDANQDQLTFLWEISSRPQGSNVTLSSSNGSTTTFSPDEDGTYVVSLVVNDGIAHSILDEVVIVSTTGNSAPTANAGPDQNILTGENAILDGRASSDPDQDTLTYEWTLIDQPSGSSSVINDSGSAIANISTDIDGVYELQLTVSDGQLERSDSIEITSTSLNVAPIANAGPDQSVSTNSLVTLDGSGSRDDDNDALSFVWQFLSVPINSSAVLNSTSAISPTFTSDIDGTYVLQLRVSDSITNSELDSISVISTTNSSSLIDQFDGTQPLLTTVNNANSLPDLTKNTGRYRANLTNNSNDITLHFNQYQGRLDAALVSFPFEFIARNVGIGRQNNSQLAPPDSGSPFLFAGVQVHDFDLNSVNSSHVVVGHRGDTVFTIEGKNTVNGNSSVNDNGENSAPLGRADIRVIGNSDRSLTVYWQTPNLAHLTQQDTWILYGPTWMTQPDGTLPGTTPTYGNSVYVGLITYAFSNTGVPFVGTCDSIEIK
jgi:hypothetical protein